MIHGSLPLPLVAESPAPPSPLTRFSDSPASHHFPFFPLIFFPSRRSLPPFSQHHPPFPMFPLLRPTISAPSYSPLPSSRSEFPRHAPRKQSMPFFHRRAKLIYCLYDQTPDMGFPDGLSLQFGDQFWTDSASFGEVSPSFSDSSSFVPQHDTTLDPFSQLLCQNAMAKNMQWRRLLVYFRSQINNFFLVRNRCPRVLLTTRAKEALLSTHFSLTVGVRENWVPDYFSLAISEVAGFLHDMSLRYGASFLWLLLLGYWIQGFRCFPWLAMSYYMKDGLHVDPAMMQFLQSTVNFPIVAKPFFGIISDAVYIGGARRLPYLVVSGALQVAAWSIVALHSGFRCSIAPLLGLLLLSNAGAALAEVVNDALVAESVRQEKGYAKGGLQSFVWLALATGGIVGNLAGGFALSRLSLTEMIGVFVILLLAQLVVSAFVKDSSVYGKFLKENHPKRRGEAFVMLKSQGVKLFELVTSPRISVPLAWFVASYAVVPALAGSLFFYQTQCLKIHPTFLGLAKVMGQMGLLAGSILYNCYFKNSSPRKVIMALQLLLSICMLSDIFLVCRLNIKAGIPDRFYVLGASAFVEAISQFKVLPFSILLARLCPAGSEASLLAFFMSCHCFASILSGYTGSLLASFLNLTADSFAGLPLAILIQSLAALLPLLWIACIPRDAKKRAEALSM